MDNNKEKIIYQLRNRVKELESQIKILEMNVREETKSKYELIKKLSQKAHEAPRT